MRCIPTSHFQIAVAHAWPIQGSWLTLLTVWAQPTGVGPKRRLPSRMTNNTYNLVSQEFNDRDRARLKY